MLAEGSCRDQGRRQGVVSDFKGRVFKRVQLLFGSRKLAVLSTEYKHFYPYMIGVYMNNIKET